MQDLFYSVKNAALSQAHAVGEALNPVLTESRFAESGVLTPVEFVQAGDLLVSKAPTWEWRGCSDPSKIRPYLPKSKQYLVTRGVPSTARASDLEARAKAVKERLVDDGEWVMPIEETSTSSSHQEADAEEDDLTEIHDEESSSFAVTEVSQLISVSDQHDDDDEYVDLADFEELNLEEEDEAAHVSRTGDTSIVRTRRYDVSLTYDKYYQTPRVWLSGQSERGVPLSPDEIFQDIMTEYRNRTVTVEKHPHLSSDVAHVSIHPCKHAAVMKKIAERVNADDGKTSLSVDRYLLVFLKFVQSVVPTINFDHTFGVSGK